MKKTITIESILGGFTQTQYFGSSDGYNSAIGVDPDYPIGSDVKTSGMLVPTRYEKFSGANITGNPKWIITNPEDEKVYVYDDAGQVASYSSALGSETDITSPTSGAGNGAAFYNNYIYLATPTNVARYGPMDGTPAIAQNVWTAATLGSQTALGNPTYPSIRGVTLPNHVMHMHGDNALYFSDVVNNQGVLHKIKTTKTTVNGDTNDGSLYNALDLPSGFYPTCIESYSTDLVIGAIQTLDSTLNQGRAALFFWDAVNTNTFYRGPVYLPDPLVTALLNVNGTIYIFSGNAQNGVRVSRYIGGESVSEVAYFEEGNPPLAGAVDALGNRVNFGAYTTYPENSASVFALGSKRRDLPFGLHNVVKTTSSGANQFVTALKYVQQSSSVKPKLVAGWRDDSAKGLDKESSTATYSSVWRSKMFNVGNKFQISKLIIPLGATLATNMSVIPKIYIDDGSTIKTLDTINSTNFSGRKAVYKRPNLSDAIGENNFFIELNWEGTVELPVLLPIVIELDVNKDR